MNPEIVQPVARFGERVGADIDHGNIGPGLRQRGRDPETNARCCPGYVGGLSLEVLHTLTP